MAAWMPGVSKRLSTRSAWHTNSSQDRAWPMSTMLRSFLLLANDGFPDVSPAILGLILFTVRFFGQSITRHIISNYKSSRMPGVRAAASMMRVLVALIGVKPKMGALRGCLGEVAT